MERVNLRARWALAALALVAACDNPLLDSVKLEVKAAVAPEILVFKGVVEIPNNGGVPAGVAVVGADPGKQVTFTIENQGRGDLEISGSPRITVGGTHADEFEIVSLPNRTIAAGTSSSFIIEFKPQDTGARLAWIEIVSNDPDEGTFHFDIEGAGVPLPGPEIQVWCGTTNIDESPGRAYDMGATYVGTPVSATFVIENIGTPGQALHLGAPSLSGADSAMFHVDTAPGTPVPEGASTTMVIRYEPTTAVGAPHQATVTFATDDADEPSYAIALLGAVRLPEIRVRHLTTELPDGSGTYDFGNCGTDGNGNTATTAITFYVDNLGDAELLVTSVTAAGDAADFDLAPGSLPRTVRPGRSTTFTAAFDPTASGNKSVTVSVVSDDADENPYTFTLTGKGVSAGKMYWTDEDYGIVFRADRDGGNVEALIQGAPAPFGVALDMAGGKVYWTEWQAARIMRADLDGSNIEQLASVSGYPDGLALDVANRTMYFANNGPKMIQKAPMDGGSVATVTGGMSGIFDVAIDSANGLLYWPDYATYRIYVGSVGGGASVLASGLPVPNGLALDLAGGLIYFTAQSGGRVYSMPIGGGAPTPITSTGPYPLGIALDKANAMLYWVDRGYGLVMRCGTSGGSPQTVFSGGSGACCIALDTVP